ncbi:MAG: hypothetical protein IPI03_23280 [Rubrivivax sp.]|nr:hypothetical protein [Rubrivivax sp.]MBK7264592.1 hypothetical protein [Rubrivivax sp.]MBK8529947.1 hypothetical protein [Rubrivivax sp.]
MTSTNLLTAVTIVTALVSGVAVAGSAQAKSGDHKRASPVLQVVSNTSLPGQASYGWQYFSNSRAAHAVVISPSGEYFLSRGNGPKQITGPAGDVLMTQPVKV